MSKEEDNKAVVGRWFAEFWGKRVNLGVVDEIAAPNMLLKYSLHEPRRGRDDIKAFMTDFRAAFPDLNFWGTADLIAEGDYVVGQWEGGGTHTGEAFDDMPIGSLPLNTGKAMRFTGTTVLKVEMRIRHFKHLDAEGDNPLLRHRSVPDVGGRRRISVSGPVVAAQNHP